MPEIVILCAMGMEAKALPKLYPVLVTGVGFRAARETAEAAIAVSRPDLMISVGTCGALDAQLELGSVFTATRILSPLGEFATVALEAAGAVLYSQDRVAVTVAEKRALYERGAGIVDMEAAAIAEVCRRNGVPFACLKAVSDLATEDLPLDFNRFREGDGGFRTAGIAFAGIMKIKALLQLQRQSKQAAERLGEALAPALKSYS